MTQDAVATVRRLVGDGIEFSGLEVHAATLEEAFVALTRHPETSATVKEPACAP